VLAIIGGTGLGQLSNLQNSVPEIVETRFGSAYLEMGSVEDIPVVFLPRHGNPSRVPPHKVNYRANIQALCDVGAGKVVSVTAVGSVDPCLEVCDLVVPDQILDYTFGREHTFFEDEIRHIDFTYPYDHSLRQALLAAADESIPDCVVHETGVYGCTQGPRLETAAEIKRMFKDGCTVVGMTAMPEAALARERGLCYAGISFVVNAGAGINDHAIDVGAISESLVEGTARVAAVINAFIKS
jgi:5'-methylthioinosine phosphorylase